MNLFWGLAKGRRERRRLLFEAAWSLVAAKLALRFVPFSSLASQCSRPPTAPMEVDEARVCRQVASAVERVANLMPRVMVCFPRGIATQAMLRRRGIRSTLYYGAREEGGGLSAHVWVQAGERGVIGMPSAEEYTVVATYPPKDSGEATGE